MNKINGLLQTLRIPAGPVYMNQAFSLFRGVFSVYQYSSGGRGALSYHNQQKRQEKPILLKRLK
tara:strand:- start:224 stop:415 length:192 start_codon:yes stop_codon:yes gene_type:complete